MITTNVYSLPQSKSTLRPPLATSKTAKGARSALNRGQDPAVRGAAGITGTIDRRTHLDLNSFLSRSVNNPELLSQYAGAVRQNVSQVVTPSKQKQFKDLPINLFSINMLLDTFGIAGHYGIRGFNIFLDSGLFNKLAPEEKELYFSHEVYELIRIIHYGMKKFGNEKMRNLASGMEQDKEGKISIENVLEWFRKFSEFNKAKSEEVKSTLNELAAFLDKGENRSTVEPLLSSIHSQAPELPDLVKAELMKYYLDKTSTEYGNYAAVLEILGRISEGTTSEKVFLESDTEVAKLFKKLAGAVIQEYASLGKTLPGIFDPLVMDKVMKQLDTMLIFASEYPVRGAAGVDVASGTAREKEMEARRCQGKRPGHDRYGRGANS